MNPLLYMKAVVGAVGASVFPPITDWLVTYIQAPPTVQHALSILFVALLTGGSIYAVPNRPNNPSSNPLVNAPVH